jgi:hypothetical protein
MANLFHQLIGRHTADPALNHWDRGRFASACTVCGRAMEKLPGLDWQLSRKAATGPA